MSLLILLGVLIVTLIYYKIVRPYSYWTDRGVKQRRQVYVLGDNAGLVLRTETILDSVCKLYAAYPKERYIGMYQFTTPTLLIRDPDLIKQITVKDFDHFVNHRPIIPDDTDPVWNKNVFALTGKKWRDMRYTLSPSFTTNKMKTIFSLVCECSDGYVEYFAKNYRATVDVDLKDTFTRYANDIITNVVFGVTCNSLEERDNEFYLMGNSATDFTGFWKNMVLFAFGLAPQLSKLLGLTLLHKTVSSFFTRIAKENIKQREEKGIVRADVMHLLLEARKGRVAQEQPNGLVDTGFATVQGSNIHRAHKATKAEITDVDIAAQALIFFFGGLQTVATFMCFLGYELAVNPEIQKKLQEEIDETFEAGGGKLTYESSMTMKYMDMVLLETLRLWPTAPRVDRVCVKPFTIEPTGTNEKPVRLVEGDIVLIPIIGLHRDHQYFPNPEKFDPERFSDENKPSINPYAYLPFGSGPRNCIGSRFALMESKAIFANLLARFDFVVTEKTPVPLRLSKTTVNLCAENGFWVGLKLRNK